VFAFNALIFALRRCYLGLPLPYRALVLHLRVFLHAFNTHLRICYLTPTPPGSTPRGLALHTRITATPARIYLPRRAGLLVSCGSRPFSRVWFCSLRLFYGRTLPAALVGWRCVCRFGLRTRATPRRPLINRVVDQWWSLPPRAVPSTRLPAPPPCARLPHTRARPVIPGCFDVLNGPVLLRLVWFTYHGLICVYYYTRHTPPPTRLRVIRCLARVYPVYPFVVTLRSSTCAVCGLFDFTALLPLDEWIVRFCTLFPFVDIALRCLVCLRSYVCFRVAGTPFVTPHWVPVRTRLPLRVPTRTRRLICPTRFGLNVVMFVVVYAHALRCVCGRLYAHTPGCWMMVWFTVVDDRSLILVGRLPRGCRAHTACPAAVTGCGYVVDRRCYTCVALYSRRAFNTTLPCAVPRLVTFTHCLPTHLPHTDIYGFTGLRVYCVPLFPFTRLRCLHSVVDCWLPYLHTAAAYIAPTLLILVVARLRVSLRTPHLVYAVTRGLLPCSRLYPRGTRLHHILLPFTRVPLLPRIAPFCWFTFVVAVAWLRYTLRCR